MSAPIDLVCIDPTIRLENRTTVLLMSTAMHPRQKEDVRVIGWTSDKYKVFRATGKPMGITLQNVSLAPTSVSVPRCDQAPSLHGPKRSRRSRTWKQ